MLKFHYRAGKSAFVALVTGLFGLACGWAWLSFGDWTMLLSALLSLAAAAKAMADVLSGTPALVIDDHGLKVRKTLGGVADVPWGQVRQMSVEVRTVRYLLIIPVARRENLVINCDGSTLGARRFRLPLKLIELPAGGSGQLMHLLHQAHAAAGGAGTRRWDEEPATGPSESAFDPDAALQRYLARRDAESAIVPEAPARPTIPQRPSFGRKGAAA